MRRLVIVGLSLGAMAGVGCGVFVTGAQAAEVVSCVRAAKVPIEYEKHGKIHKKSIYEGKYGTKCREAAPEHTNKYPGYEGPEGHWERGAVGAHFVSKSSKGKVKPKLQFSNGEFVQCIDSGGEGEFLSPKTGTEKSVFAECHVYIEERRVGEACTTSGGATGEIKTAPVPFKLVSWEEELPQYHYNANDEEEGAPTPFSYEKGKVFMDFEAGSEVYAEFACGPTASYRIYGGVSGPIHSKFNVEGKKLVWDVEPGGGTQNLYAKESTDGGATWVPTGRVQESYEAKAADNLGLELLEPFN